MAVKEKRITFEVRVKGQRKAERSLGKSDKRLKSVGRSAEKTSKSMKRMGASTGVLGKNVGALRSQLLLVTVALGGALVLFRSIVKATVEQDKAIAKLNQALISTKRVAGLTSSELQGMASAFQEVTTFGDEATITAQALLLTFTNIGKDVFPKAIETILNMSTAMDQGLKESTIQLGKALNDPIIGVTALRRVGVQLTQTQEDQIKAFVKLNDLAGAQEIILGELATQMGGQARAQADTLGGSFTQLSNAIGDLKEDIGDLIAPTLIRWAKATKDIVNAIQDLIDAADISDDLKAPTEAIGRLAIRSADLRIAMSQIASGAISGRRALLDLGIETTTFATKNQALKQIIEEYNATLIGLTVLTKQYNVEIQSQAAATVQADIAFRSFAGTLEEWSNSFETMNMTTEIGTARMEDFLDGSQLLAVQGIGKLSGAFATAAVNGQKMGDAVVSALKAIAAELIAQAAIFALLSIFTGGTIGFGGGAFTRFLNTGQFESTQTTNNINITTPAIIGTNQQMVDDQLIPMIVRGLNRVGTG